MNLRGIPAVFLCVTRQLSLPCGYEEAGRRSTINSGERVVLHVGPEAVEFLQDEKITRLHLTPTCPFFGGQFIILSNYYIRILPWQLGLESQQQISG